MKTIISKPNTRNAKFLWAFFLILFITHHSSFITSAHAQACASTTPSVLAKWTFQEFTANAQCNGAIQRSNAASRIYPVLKSDAYVYCPDINSGCGQALLGSTGHTNTTDFSNALCLMNFYYVESLIGGKFCTGIPCNGYDPNSTVWNPAIPANIYTTYIIPQGKYGCLSSFSLKISTPNSTTPTFAKQGVAVYRNGVQIYSQTQNITKPHEVMTFTFPSTAMFCSDGSKEVTYKVVFGLVERLTDFKAGRPTGYDDITINGTCGSNPSPIAAVTPATCSATGANSDGRISVVPGSFATTYKAAYSKGSTYTGTATYASGSTAIPITGTVDAKLPNPASPQTYTMRIFSPTCYTDKTVTLNPVVCPVTCSSPTAKVAAVLATCTGTTANNNAQIAVTGVTYGDKVAISTGATYTGTATYTTATPLVSAAYTFTGLPNPATNQTYTVRVYNGSNTCFKDFQVILANKDCTPVIACTFPDGTVNATPATCTGGIANSDAQINVSGVSNGDKAAYSIGNTYTGTTTYATATALVSGATNFTGLANPAANQTYTVRIYNGSNTCFKDYQVILANKDCAPVVPCTFPDGIVNTTSATCTGSTANSDAKINVSGVSNGDKAAYSVGNTYTGTTNYATATTLVGGATNFLGLENPAVSQVYTVRIFNGKDNCYKDFPVTINTTICVPTCTTPTGTVTPTQATCTGSTANSNAQIAITAVSNGDKVAYSIGSVFSGNNYSAATALVGGAYTFTALPNTVGGQIYTVRIYNGSDACYRDYSVTINEKICVPTCTTPTGTVTTTQATCTGSTANSDAQIAISAVSNGDKVAYSVGSEFSGNNYSVATALVGGAYTFTALPNTVGGEIYTIRIYNGSDACYRDYSVTINEKTCVPACTRPTGTITPTDATCTAGTANNNAQIAITAVTNGNKVGIFADDIYTGPAYSAATALVSGAYTFTALSNPTSVTTYTIRVFNGNDVCYQDYNVNINSTTCPVPIPPCVPPIGTVLTATQATCGASGMTNIDANVAVTAVTGGDKVGISAGDSYTGVSYDKAVALAAGAYTFTGLPNPSGTQVYTVRVFNGADDCFTDETVTLTEKVCGACQTACGSISSALATDAVSSNNTACFAICLGTQNIDLKLTAGVSPTAGSTCGSTGTDFVWTFTLQNTGTMAATDIQVADLMPDGLTFDSANPSVGTYSPGSGWLVPSLAAGASATLTVTTKALVAGTYKYTAEVMSASPLNDPNSTPANGVSTEDDYSSATATATGNSSPTISKEFSPMQTKANTPVRLTIKITNNEPTPVSLTQDFIDVFPTSPVGGTPSAMVVAATPNLSSNLTGVIATAGGASIKIPSGTVLLPGLNQISVDVIVPSDGMYCNDIAVGSLKTTMGNNCLATEACVIASSNFQIPPSIKKSFSVSSVNTNTNATLTITIQNQDPLNFTLSEKFVDYLPTGLILGGATSGTCPNISTFGSTDQVGLTAGAVIPTGSCTIVVPVKSATAGTYCNRIGLNQLTGTIGTYENIGNQNIAEACLTVVAAPCAAIDLTSITQSPIGNIAPNATVNFTTLGTGIDATKTAFNWSNSSIGGRFNPQGNTATWTAPTTAGVYTLKVMGDNQVTGYGACKDSVTLSITVTQACTPPVATILPKIQTICVGSVAAAYTVSPSTGVEYTWYGPLADTTNSLGTAIASQTTAMFTPSGTTLTTAGTKYYAVVVNNTGEVTCADTAFVKLVINPKPIIADNSVTICAGESVDLTSKITNYNTYLSPVWTVGTASGTAVTTPSSVKPTATTTYVLVAQNAAGCKDTANVVVTVNLKPIAGTDQTLACANAATNTLTISTTLVPSPAGGAWAQLGTTPATATISGNNVTDMSVAGTYQFVYTLNGCKDTVAVTVSPCAGCVKPDAGADAASVCQPTSTAKLTAVTAGGTWAPIGSPANPSAATIDASGNISGLNAAGTYRFVYSVTGGGQTCTDTAQVIVLAKPTIADGSATICAGESVDLISKISNYNTYLSPAWTIGTASGTAVTTPSSVKPTATTTYVLVAQNAAGCKDTANVVVTVNPKPSAGTDQTLACANTATNTLTTSTTLVPSPVGGAWTQLGTTPATATISGNNVTGMSVAGTYQFVYTLNGCTDTVAVTVSPCAGCVKPDAGPDAASVCQPTSTAKLTAVTAGGTWAPIGSPANPSAATIDGSGNISGLNAAGTYKFVYSVTGGGQTCTDTAQVVVLAKPTIADGSATICAGESVDLTTKITSYGTYLSPAWTIGTASGTAVTTPSSVKPTATTTYVLVAQNAAGCKDTANVVVTVNPKPIAGTDQMLACANTATNTLTTSTTLVPSPAGGTWTQLGTTPATATISGNNVTGMSVAGTYQFVYTLNGCTDTVAVTVSPCAGCVKPDAGPDAASVCQPTSTAKLTAVTAGGTWAPIGSPANPSAATIDASGNISGLNAAGTYRFVYSVTGGGQTCTDTAQVIVDTKPVITVANGYPSCRQNGTAYSIKFVATGGVVSTVPTLTVTGDSITTIPLTTSSIKLIITSPTGCRDTLTVNAPICDKPVGSIGDLIWKDFNNNGVQDLPAEKGVAGIKVNVYAALGGTKTGSVLQSKTTATEGDYLFTGLLAGDYVVEIDKTSLNDTCAISTKQNTGTDDTKDSDFNPTTGLSQVITLSPVFNPTTPAELLATNNFTVDAALAKVVLCAKPTLTLGGVVCTGNSTYSVNFSASGGSVTVSAGTLNGNTITGIPVGVNVVVTASNGVGCTVSATQQSPSDCSQGNNCSLPLLGVGQPICNGTTYSVAFNVVNGNVTTSAGVVSGNAVISIPVGVDVVLTASNSPTCSSKVEVKSPTDCSSPCVNADVSVSLPVCEVVGGSTYKVNYLTTTETVVTSNVGTVGTGVITAIPSGTTLVLTVKKAGCPDKAVTLMSKVCPDCVKPSFKLITPTQCSSDNSTYSVVVEISGKLGTPKFSSGIATGTNPYTISGIPNGANLRITDSLNSVCQFDTVIVGQNCNCMPKLPILLTASMTACAGDTFPTMKATVVGLATVEWFTQSTGGTVVSTGLSYKPSGNVPATGAAYYAQARSTDPSCPTAISTSRVMATINAQDCTKEVDLALKKSINTKIAQIGDVLTYTLKVWNESNSNATGVEVADSIATTVQFVAGSFAASRGSATITGNVINWNVGNIAANGDTATLTYRVKATQEGVHFNTAEISKVNEKDKDSSPSNGKDSEDDMDRQCFTVPFKLCTGSKVEASVPTKYTNVQWFKDGGSVPIASGNVVLLSGVGIYTYTASNQACPTGGCCPIIIENSTNCCPIEKCVPFTIKKIKK